MSEAHVVQLPANPFGCCSTFIRIISLLLLAKLLTIGHKAQLNIYWAKMTKCIEKFAIIGPQMMSFAIIGLQT
jgi:hypothetical protein